MSLIFALQALLIRHESYVSDAEQDRRRMEEKVEVLEQEKRDLEDMNAQTVDENRKLTEQLESLSNACAESELKILSLTELLRSADQELERLTGLAARTEGLQIQLGRLEDEQAALHATITTTKEQEHAVLLRWQKAERTVISLQDQIDRIEHDAREERERHMEVMISGSSLVALANSYRSLSAWNDDVPSRQNCEWQLDGHEAPLLCHRTTPVGMLCHILSRISYRTTQTFNLELLSSRRCSIGPTRKWRGCVWP
jgi:chromosome segregation ATPase